jgi:predicted DNA-binding transcriptional regulator AlpA
MNSTDGRMRNRAERQASAAEARRRAPNRHVCSQVDGAHLSDDVESRIAHPPKLDTRKAAEHCGIGHSTLVKYRVFGGGPPFFKIGRRVVYDPDDLDDWLEERRRLSTSDRGDARAR